MPEDILLITRGTDDFGNWMDVHVGSIPQRFRWCSPGTFIMGSPENEPGHHFETQSNVTLTRGFWMADTPVTQALYEAVMGNNPSYFQHPSRPVEQVDWIDAVAFCNALEDRLRASGMLGDDLCFRLPTAAEWEYACRAGTVTATYAGPMKIKGTFHAPVLDDIAWYGGNSGVGYDLPGGCVSYCSKRDHQYLFNRYGTRLVKQKRPNPWGLYDTLGNVGEWCADSNLESRVKGASFVDPFTFDPQSRSTRGGSWSGPADLSRAASSICEFVLYRSFNHGFRLSRGVPHPLSYPLDKGSLELLRSEMLLLDHEDM